MTEPLLTLNRDYTPCERKNIKLNVLIRSLRQELVLLYERNNDLVKRVKNLDIQLKDALNKEKQPEVIIAPNPSFKKLKKDFTQLQSEFDNIKYLYETSIRNTDE